jgi:hypothetical protein
MIHPPPWVETSSIVHFLDLVLGLRGSTQQSWGRIFRVSSRDASGEQHTTICEFAQGSSQSCAAFVKLVTVWELGRETYQIELNCRQQQLIEKLD